MHLLTEKIPHLGREKVFAILGNFYLQKTASRRWFHEVKFTIFDINYLDKLRQELNIYKKQYENTTIKKKIL